MAIDPPIWLQAVEYPARLDRAFISQIMRGKERVFEGLAVSQASPSANFTVRVAVGSAAIEGDDETAQGMYYVTVTSVETPTVPATPGSGTRTDSVVLRVRDEQAGGDVGDDAVVEVISGTTVPPSAILLATIARSAGESAILDAAITDARPLGGWPYSVGVGPPPAGLGVEGDLYIQTG